MSSIGMVKQHSVMSALLQILSIVTMTTFCYLIIGYSLAFGPSTNHNGHASLYYGDGSMSWLYQLTPTSVHQLAPTIPESVFAIYQLAFAIITHALICGSIADRLKYHSMMAMMFLWHIAVYCPIAHANWYYTTPDTQTLLYLYTIDA
jgi:Amt family ammonium transporter